MKVLFVGDRWMGSNARSLADGFSSRGHQTAHVDTTGVSRPARWSSDWFAARLRGERSRRSQREVIDQIRRFRSRVKFDMAICFKTIHIDQSELLSALEGIPVRFHYSADDVSNPYNLTPDYLEYEKAWDFIITTKRFNVDELRERGVREAHFIWSAYDPRWHYRAPRVDPHLYAAGFIGNRRLDREDLIARLSQSYKRRLRIEGPGWDRLPALERTGAVVGKGVYGQDFSSCVASIRANLLLLNSDNRDTHTCRSFELPAAGGLVVGIRTDEHMELFEDGRDALLFESEAELFDVLQRVDADEDYANAIAGRGYRAIVEGGNTYGDRADEIAAMVS